MSRLGHWLVLACLLAAGPAQAAITDVPAHGSYRDPQDLGDPVQAVARDVAEAVGEALSLVADGRFADADGALGDAARSLEALREARAAGADVDEDRVDAFSRLHGAASRVGGSIFQLRLVTGEDERVRWSQASYGALEAVRGAAAEAGVVDPVDGPVDAAAIARARAAEDGRDRIAALEGALDALDEEAHDVPRVRRLALEAPANASAAARLDALRERAAGDGASDPPLHRVVSLANGAPREAADPLQVLTLDPPRTRVPVDGRVRAAGTVFAGALEDDVRLQVHLDGERLTEVRPANGSYAAGAPVPSTAEPGSHRLVTRLVHHGALLGEAETTVWVQAPTRLEASTDADRYGPDDEVRFRVSLTTDGDPIAGERVVVTFGEAADASATGPDGTLELRAPADPLPPGTYRIQARFAGDRTLAPAADTASFTVGDPGAAEMASQGASGVAGPPHWVSGVAAGGLLVVLGGLAAAGRGRDEGAGRP